MKKKLFLIPLLSFLFFVLFSWVNVRPAHAGLINTIKGWVNTVKTISAVVNDPGENMSQLTGKLAYGAAENTLITVAPELLDEEQRKDIPESMRKGLLGLSESAVVAMFEHQPKVDVIAHLAGEWVPGYDKESSSVYASGYDDLKQMGVADLWGKIRNIAYLGYVLIMIVIGFMIMFRNKIGGQTMVTIGNSLPKIVISLILVTFSFAIIGLIIDFGGIITRVVSNLIFEDIGGGLPIHNPFALLWGFMKQEAVNTYKSPNFALTATGLVGFFLMPPFGIGGILLIIIGLVLAGVIIVGAIKLWIVLVKAYLGLLIDVITAPVKIMVGAMPGQNAQMFEVFKSALRNVLVFPLAFAIVNLPYLLEGNSVNLGFPETLVGVSNDSSGSIGGFLLGVAKIMAIYAAASAPSMLKTVIPANESQAGAKAGEDIQKSLGGIPLIGGMFKK